MAENPKRLTQYIAAVGSTMGGFALGTVIGWSSPAEHIIRDNYSFSDEGLSWISSIMTLGAAASQIYMALTLDLLGRKLSMLVIAIPFVIGWIVLAAANSVVLFCVGRFITGFCGGSFCVAAPTYIGEIADKGIRGTLTTFFQLLLVIGILTSYALGEFNKMLVITIPLCAGPGLLFLVMMFLPESPVLLYKRGKVEKAQKALQFFRGTDYNITSEMKEMEEYTKSTTENFWDSFKTKACIKAFLMLIAMHGIQQLSGINAVMFFAHNIFEMAGSHLSAGSSAIILAFVQVVLTTVAAYLVDRAGRKLLWLISLGTMGGCLLLMGVYFMIKRNDEETAKSLAWLPLILICLYLAGFSLGAGPLPFVMLGEFLPNTVKGYLGSFIVFFNWMLAFAITRSFKPLVDVIGADVVFWIYAAICGAGIAFVVLVLIETNNKTLEEIQNELAS